MRVLSVGTHAKTELLIRPSGFDYSCVEADAAERLRSAAARIRERVKKTLEDLIVVGRGLVAVKDALPHGQFGPWLEAEFGWRERMAQHFMSVAERFGPKTAIIADLTIQPTAAYLLAAPSVPDEARETAVKPAEAGERITVAVAKEIVARARKRNRNEQPRSPDDILERLQHVLEKYKARLGTRHWPALARQLQEFAERLANGHRGTRNGKG